MLDWIAGLIDAIGAPAVGILMFLENVFPPIPSELIMPLAGYQAGTGQVSIVAVILWGTLGSLAGAYLWYVVGRWIGMERMLRFAARHGRWLTLTPAEIRNSAAWFDRHGGKAVLLGRLVPTVRTLISVPAGIARMPRLRFVTYSAAGTAVWSSMLAMLGYVMGAEFRAATAWLDTVSTAIVVLAFLLYLYRVATFRRRIATG